MINSNNDETRPTPVEQEVPIVGETVPTPVKSEPSPTLIEGDTVVTNVSDAVFVTDTDLVSVTHPPQVPSERQITAITTEPKPWRWLLLLSVFALVLIASVGAWGGYRAGISQRINQESTQISGQVKEQFDLGVQDRIAGRYEAARQRLEFVIQHDPGYPGVTDQLAAVLLALNTTATATRAPLPTLIPTLDTRSSDELFSQARSFLEKQGWSGAIDALLVLRKNDPSYQTVKVDSMFYVALRNRGVHEILNDGDLEAGTYDLALAERFGPLDVEASNYRTWANIYVTGVSFWGLDWEQSVSYFYQLLQIAPNLRDLSNITATERFITATVRYGDFLAQNDKWCLAIEQYKIAYSYNPNLAIAPTATWVTDKCAGGNKPTEERHTEQPSITPSPTGVGPGEPSPTPSATEALAIPTASPTPTPTEVPTEPIPQPTITPTP